MSADRVADVVIAGAGIIGASIAWKLAQAGLRISLLDANIVGGEASWAGAGMLAPGGEIEQQSSWSDFALESLRMYPAFIGELQAESGAKIDYRRPGAVEIARTPAEWDALLARADLQRQCGIRWALLDRQQVREMVPLLDREIAGALFFAEDALVDPRDIMTALRLACCTQKVRILERERVVSMQALAGTVEITTEAHTLAAAHAVIAAGAWSGQVTVLVNGSVQKIPESFPVKGHLLGYQLAPGSLRPILRYGPTYLLQRSSGFTIAGTSSERVGFDRHIDPRIVSDIARRVSVLAPGLSTAPIPIAWTGLRPAIEGLMPVIGRLPGSNIWLAYGHYRNGILLAPATAKRIAAEIVQLRSSRETDLISPSGSH